MIQHTTVSEDRSHLHHCKPVDRRNEEAQLDVDPTPVSLSLKWCGKRLIHRIRSKQQAVSVRDDDGVEDDDEDRADDRPHPHLLSDDRDCEIGRPMRNPAKGGETEEEHNDLRAVRSSLSDRSRCRPRGRRRFKVQNSERTDWTTRKTF